MNRRIRLTESELRFVVEDATKRIVRQKLIEEGFLDSVKNLGSNMMNTFRTSRFNKKVQQAATQAVQTLNQLRMVAGNVNPNLSQIAQKASEEIHNTVNAAQQNLQNARQYTFSTKARPQNANAYAAQQLPNTNTGATTNANLGATPTNPPAQGGVNTTDQTGEQVTNAQSVDQTDKRTPAQVLGRQ